jgi:hypothetical protein
MIYSREFLDELFLKKDREVSIKINLLTWNEIKIKEIQGIVMDGSLSVDGNSIVRRTVNFNIVLDPETYYLPEVANEITISRKISVSIGLKNNTKYIFDTSSPFSEEIIWFDIGVFVPTDVSLNHDIDNNSISISAQDKMVLLNGDVAGELGYDIDFINTITNQSLPYQTVIKDCVSFFGGIDESKVVVLDVPFFAESLTRVPAENFTFYGNGQNGTAEIFFSSAISTSSFQIGQTVVQTITGEVGEGLLSASSTITAILANSIQINKNIVTSGNFTFYISPAIFLYSTTTGNYGKRTFNINTATSLTAGSGTLLSPSIESGQILPLQLTLSPKNKDTKIEVASTDLVTTILEKVKSDLLGEYEYFFNISGDFVFQFKKNLESSFSNIELFQNDDGRKYLTNFDSIPYIYDLSNKEIISSYSNSPTWKGIKNDFYIYGANNLLYHLVIDTIPAVPAQFYTQNTNGTWTSNLSAYSQPWQQYIIDLTEYNAQENPSIEENRYYAELKRYFEYNVDTNSGIYKKLSATTGVWRSKNTGEESNDFDFTNRPNGDPLSWNYFFDMINDTNPVVGVFSVNSIGRRIKSIKDDNITIIYPRTLESNYLDSSNRQVKVILYEDLESIPLNNISSITVTGNTTATVSLSSPVDVRVSDQITLESPYSLPIDLPAGLLGTFTVTSVASGSSSFTFTTSQSVTNSTYYLNFNRNTYATTNAGSTTIRFFNGTETFTKNSLIFGSGIAANSYISFVDTSNPNFTTLTVRPSGTIAQVPYNTTFSFSAISASLAQYSIYAQKNQDPITIENEFESLEIPYVSILKSQIENILDNQEFQYKSDAFSAMKNLIYLHTRFNESVSVSSIPIYFLEPNQLITLEDRTTGISGEHYLQSFTIPLSNEGTMNLSAIKVQK